MNSNDLTYLQKLQDYYSQHTVIPSFTVMMALMNFKSRSSVAALFARLKLAGFLENAPSRRLRPTRRFFERYLVSSPVRAGFPSPISEDCIESITIDQYLVERPSETVLVTVKGDSMNEAGIHSGDIVVVEKRSHARLGEVVVAIVDNEFTLKYLDKEKNQFILRPANKAYPVIRPKQGLELFGVVIGLFRKYRS